MEVFLPRRQFLRRTKPPSPDTNTTEVQQQEDTKKVLFPRGPSKFSRNETTRFNSNGGARRTERPRNFVRRRPEGSVTTSSTASPGSSPSSTTTRRPFRIASRRRPSSTTSTPAPTTTTPATTMSLLESDEYLQDIGDIDAIEDPTLEPRAPKKPLKAQRRPLVNLKDATVRSTDKSTDQNPSATNEETKRQSKKYSSTFRQNQLDGLLKKEDTSTTVDAYDAETALAIATHKLITAPLPIINDYDDTQTKTAQTDRTTDYTLTPPDIASTFGQYDTRNTDKSDIDTGKVTLEYPSSTYEYEATHRPTNDYIFTTPGPTKTFATLDVTKVFTTPDVTKAFATPEVTGYTGYTGIQRGTVKYSEFATVPNPTLRYNRYPTRSSQERSDFTREYLLESPVTKSYDDEYQYLSPTSPQTPRKVYRKKIQRRISTTLRPTVAALSSVSPDSRALYSPRLTSTYVPKVTSTTYETKVTSPSSSDPTTDSPRTYLPRVTKPSGFVPKVTEAEAYWPEGNDQDYLPEVTGRAYVAEVTSRNYVPEVTARYLPEVTSRPYLTEITSEPYVSEVTSIRNYSPKETSTRNYSPEESSTRNYSREKSSTRNYSPDVTETRDYSPGKSSTRNYSPEKSSTRNYSPEVTETSNYSPEVTATRNYSPETKKYTPQMISTRNYSPEPSSTRNYSPVVTSTRNYSLEVTTPRIIKPKVTTPKPFEKKKTYKPVVNFDYYDDSAEKIALKYAEGTKVIYHGKGSVECLDVGNFPHPSSCKKFISCARMEFGSLLGWEYVCPKGLSFDPVGGICNWSAGLGCDEKDF